MKPAPFDYHLAASTEDAVAALAAADDGDAKVLAGGQSLLPLLSLRLAAPTMLVDINEVPGLGYHRFEADCVAVGATCRHRDVELDPEVVRRAPVIAEAVAQIGHVAIRNRGTVVGSLAHADPSAEWPLLAVLLDAQLVLEGPRGRRVVAADDFFVGFFSTSMEPDELLVEARFPLPPPTAGAAFLELARRHGDFSVVAAGVVVDTGPDGSVRSSRIVLNGVDARPVRVPDAEAVLTGRPAEPDALDEAARAAAAAIEPSADIHGSAGYRRSLAEVLTRRALDVAVGRIRDVDEGERGAG